MGKNNKKIYEMSQKEMLDKMFHFSTEILQTENQLQGIYLLNQKKPLAECYSEMNLIKEFVSNDDMFLGALNDDLDFYISKNLFRHYIKMQERLNEIYEEEKAKGTISSYDEECKKAIENKLNSEVCKEILEEKSEYMGAYKGFNDAIMENIVARDSFDVINTLTKDMENMVIKKQKRLPSPFATKVVKEGFFNDTNYNFADISHFWHTMSICAINDIWKNTKQIYTVNENLALDFLHQGEITLPFTALKNLPFRTIYLDLTNLNNKENRDLSIIDSDNSFWIEGALIRAIVDERTKKSVLCVYLHWKIFGEDAIIPFNLNCTDEDPIIFKQKDDKFLDKDEWNEGSTLIIEEIKKRLKQENKKISQKDILSILSEFIENRIKRTYDYSFYDKIENFCFSDEEGKDNIYYPLFESSLSCYLRLLNTIAKENGVYNLFQNDIQAEFKKVVNKHSDEEDLRNKTKKLGKNEIDFSLYVYDKAIYNFVDNVGSKPLETMNDLLDDSLMYIDDFLYNIDAVLRITFLELFYIACKSKDIEHFNYNEYVYTDSLKRPYSEKKVVTELGSHLKYMHLCNEDYKTEGKLVTKYVGEGTGRHLTKLRYTRGHNRRVWHGKRNSPEYHTEITYIDPYYSDPQGKLITETITNITY